MKNVPLLSGALIGSMFIFGSCSGADFKDEMYLVGASPACPTLA
ncbi:MAG: hypothetical protein QGH51_03130 [Planctomycetota bacterium]|nr:hypothetical protein [Planctomycetota bacterium]